MKTSTLTFEDFPQGHFGTFGPRHVTREDIIAFAREYDPQPMHLDDAAAEASMLKGLSGSGWHLCSIIMRMMFDGFIGRTESLGSPDVEIAQARVSKSRPSTGIVTFKCSVRNAAGQVLADMVSPIIVKRRAPEAVS